MLMLKVSACSRGAEETTHDMHARANERCMHEAREACMSVKSVSSQGSHGRELV